MITIPKYLIDWWFVFLKTWTRRLTSTQNTVWETAAHACGTYDSQVMRILHRFSKIDIFQSVRIVRLRDPEKFLAFYQNLLFSLELSSTDRALAARNQHMKRLTLVRIIQVLESNEEFFKDFRCVDKMECSMEFVLRQTFQCNNKPDISTIYQRNQLKTLWKRNSWTWYDHRLPAFVLSLVFGIIFSHHDT